MPNGTYGGVRGRETKVGQKLSFPDLLDYESLDVIETYSVVKIIT